MLCECVVCMCVCVCVCNVRFVVRTLVVHMMCCGSQSYSRVLGDVQLGVVWCQLGCSVVSVRV